MGAREDARVYHLACLPSGPHHPRALPSTPGGRSPRRGRRAGRLRRRGPPRPSASHPPPCRGSRRRGPAAGPRRTCCFWSAGGSSAPTGIAVAARTTGLAAAGRRRGRRRSAGQLPHQSTCRAVAPVADRKRIDHGGFIPRKDIRRVSSDRDMRASRSRDSLLSTCGRCRDPPLRLAAGRILEGGQGRGVERPAPVRTPGPRAQRRGRPSGHLGNRADPRWGPISGSESTASSVAAMDGTRRASRSAAGSAGTGLDSGSGHRARHQAPRPPGPAAYPVPAFVPSATRAQEHEPESGTS